MINENILIFFVILVLTYVFDHKILPQLGLLALTAIQVFFIVTSNTLTQTDVYYLALYLVNGIYILFMVLVAPMEKDMEMVV